MEWVVIVDQVIIIALVGTVIALVIRLSERAKWLEEVQIPWMVNIATKLGVTQNIPPPPPVDD